MKKILSVILSAAMLFSLSAATFAEEKEKLVVAVSPDYEPFEYYEGENLAGFDIDLMNSIGEKIGYEIEYIPMDFDLLMVSVNEGNADCAISTLTVTEERKKYVRFTRTYLDVTKVQTENGEVTDVLTDEKYAVVFSLDAEKDELYTLVDNAIQELYDDGTIESLIQKYNLTEPYDQIFYDDDLFYYSFVGEYTPGKIQTAPGGWADEDVDRAYAAGIPDGVFYSFQSPVTRESFAQMIYNLVLAVKGEISALHPTQFTDTDNKKMLVLSGLGIIKGKSETELAPADQLTREQAATILDRVGQYLNVSLNSLYFDFADEAEISDWAKASVQNMCNLGVMQGVEDNKFDPKGAYTVEQAMVTVMRMYDTVVVPDNANAALKFIDKDGEIILTEEDIVSAEYEKDENSDEWYVILTLTDDGRERYKDATKRILQYADGENYIKIMLGETHICSPRVNGKIDATKIVIAGGFTKEKAQRFGDIISFEK